MNQPTVASLATRLERLERENRRLKAVGLVALAAIASVFVMGQARPARIIEAEMFKVVDRTGHEVASLGGGYVGDSQIAEPFLMFRDRDGTPISYLLMIDGESTLRIGTAGGASSALLHTRRDGDVRLQLSGVSGEGGAQAHMRVLPGDSAASIFLTNAGGPTAVMQSQRGVSPYV